ncbi:MAG: cyanoexosortase B [Cyanobacteria bacterium J06649_4]
MLNATAKKQLSPEILILGLLAVLYIPLLWHWVDGWLNKSISIQHEYFSHGLLGIPFAAYLVWEARFQWHKLSNAAHWAALPLLFIAAAFYISGLPDMMNLSLPLLLAGLLFALKGTAGFRLYAFPLALVVLATPTQLPYIIEPYILPLQSFIASVAGFILQQLNVDVYVDGIYLYVNDQLVEVAPHCAGLKMMFTRFYRRLILTYWTGLSKSRLRTGLFFSGIIGISVIGNIIRNAALTYFHGMQMTGAFEWLHDSWGGDLYSALMLGLLIVLVKLIERFIPKSLKVATASATSNSGSISDSSLPSTGQSRSSSRPQRPDYF